MQAVLTRRRINRLSHIDRAFESAADQDRAESLPPAQPHDPLDDLGGGLGRLVWGRELRSVIPARPSVR